MWIRVFNWHLFLYFINGYTQRTLQCKNTSIINATANTNVTLNGTAAIEDCDIAWYRSHGADQSLCQYNATKAFKPSARYTKINYNCNKCSLIIFNVNESTSGLYYTLALLYKEHICIREKICYYLKVTSTNPSTTSTLLPLTTNLIAFEKRISPSAATWSTLSSLAALVTFAYLVKTVYHYWTHGHYYVPQIWRRRPGEEQTYRHTVTETS
ncbi:Ba28 [Baboon cytomegalovirus]|nr:Ba28 [Baboon cytomegalovirus]